MRILFDSKELCFKDPFGTLTPGQECRLNIHIPASVGTVKVACVLDLDGTGRQVIVGAFLGVLVAVLFYWWGV